MGTLGIKKRSGTSSSPSDIWAGTRQHVTANGLMPAMFRPRAGTVFQVPSLGGFAKLASPAESTAGSLSTVVESAKRKVQARPSDNGTGVSI